MSYFNFMKFFSSIVVLFLLGASLSANAQSGGETLTGKVSYKSGANIYVRFANTEKISVGDTLFYRGNACMVVKQKSSQSCVTQSLKSCNPARGATIVARQETQPEINQTAASKTDKTSDAKTPADSTAATAKVKYEPKEPYQERITGRISAATYSSGSELPDKGVTRYVSRLRFNARHINNSRFSIDAYANYRQIARQDPDFTGDNSRFTVYNLAAHYQLDSTARLTFGRSINRYAASLGALDGAQMHKNWKHFYAGAIAGFQPAITDYSLDLNKLQYGAYGGLQFTETNFYSKTTFGLLEQRNKGNVDRRFLYAQNSSSLGPKLFLFASSEVEVYQKFDSTAATSKASLTSLYLSARYRLSRHLSLFSSYDTRKNIIYYDSFTTEVERLLSEQAARQGLRFRLGLSNWHNITARLGYAKRYQKDNSNDTESYQAYASYHKLPFVKGRISARYLENRSSTFTIKVQSYRYYRYLFQDKLQLSAYYRTLSYEYATQEIEGPTQNYYGLEANYDFNREWTLGLLGEISTQDGIQNHRFNTRLIKRFNFN